MVDEFETLYDRDLSEEELAAVREKFDQMYVTRDVYRIYNWFLEENGWEQLPDVPYESRMPVSYTHLEVYKRQDGDRADSAG